MFEARTIYMVAIWPIGHPHEIKSGNKGEGQVAFLVMCEVNPFVDLALFYFAGYDLVITFHPRIALITTSFTDGKVPDCHSRRPESVHTFSHRQLSVNQQRVKVRIIGSHMGSSW